MAEDWGVSVAALPEPIKELIKDRAAGNPMIAIALASAAREGGDLKPFGGSRTGSAKVYHAS